MDKEAIRRELENVHNEIRSFIHETPVLKSKLINEIAGCSVYFKCENFQKMGAFKMRGALNAILKLSIEERKKGVVTHSSGNMAQAVALAAKSLEVPAYIVMPENAPKVKKNAVRDYGGQIFESGNNIFDREALANKIIDAKACSFVHPSNDINVIFGQATAAKELLHSQPDLDFVLTPVGGGGLLAGTALAVDSFGNECQCFAGEPSQVDDASRSLKSGKIEFNDSTNTIADGLRTNLGDVNFPIIQRLVKDIITVEESEIIDAMKLIWERLKIVIEPSSAVPFAAVLQQKDKFKGARVGIILSGGNVDLSKLPF